MSHAIKITVKRAEGDHDLGASKFFGTPTVPLAWQDDFYDDEMFFCQIRLSDIAALDTENKLPHKGYLYVFLYTGEGDFGLEADVRYCEDEPELAIDDFNSEVEGYERFTEAYLMDFSLADENEICTRLFGEPSDWNYADEPPSLLMQFDPLDNDMDFAPSLDGFLYLFFGKDKKGLSDVSFHAEYS